MLVNETNLDQAVGDSILGHMVEFNHLVDPWFGFGPMEWVAVTLSSIHVLLNIIVVMVLVFYIKNNAKFENSCYFIINLAVTDLVGFIMLLLSIMIQYSMWSDHADHSSFNPLTYSTKMRDGCQVQMGLLSFAYLNSVFATISLTIDRYIFISRPLGYKVLMTKTKIKALIGITWIVPILVGGLTFFTTNLDVVKMCIITHTSSKWPNFVTAALFLVTIIVTYGLYMKILLKYWGLKRRLSVMAEKNLAISAQKNNTISRRAQNMLTLLKNSKYAIFVITAYTVCWLPWVLLEFADIYAHESGILKNRELECGHWESLGQTNLTDLDHFRGQACVHELMSDHLTQCDVPGNGEEACKAIQEHLHDYLIFCATGVCIIFSVLSSLINPVIHGIWCPGFRKAVWYSWSRYKRVSGQSKSDLR